MTAEDYAIAAFQSSGLLEVLTWAAPAAFAATDQLYDEDSGHDQGVVGYLNFKHMKDLMDRATSNGRFVLGDDVDGVGSDVMERGITPEVFRSMPSLASDAVASSDYQQSPGWAIEGYRVLLQSYPFGKVDDIKWVQRSDAKRRVASQHFIGENALFDDEEFGLESIPGIPDDDDFAGVSRVAAQPSTGRAGQERAEICSFMTAVCPPRRAPPCGAPAGGISARRRTGRRSVRRSARSA